MSIGTIPTGISATIPNSAPSNGLFTVIKPDEISTGRAGPFISERLAPRCLYVRALELDRAFDTCDARAANVHPSMPVYTHIHPPSSTDAASLGSDIIFSLRRQEPTFPLESGYACVTASADRILLYSARGCKCAHLYSRVSILASTEYG